MDVDKKLYVYICMLDVRICIFGWSLLIQLHDNVYMFSLRDRDTDNTRSIVYSSTIRMKLLVCRVFLPFRLDRTLPIKKSNKNDTWLVDDDDEKGGVADPIFHHSGDTVNFVVNHIDLLWTTNPHVWSQKNNHPQHEPICTSSIDTFFPLQISQRHVTGFPIYWGTLDICPLHTCFLQTGFVSLNGLGLEHLSG